MDIKSCSKCKKKCAAGRALLAIARIPSVKNKIFTEIKEEVASVLQRDPAAKSSIEVVLLYSGVHAMLAYRVANKLYRSKYYFSARCVSQIAKMFTGIEIHPGATIGHGFFIDHGTGVVIGETTEIGNNCTIYQGVTLGGTGKDLGKRHPTIGDNVLVGAGAKVLGPVNIGSNSKIAAGAVVLRDIPEDSTAVGIPAKVVRKAGRKVADDLDQIHIPDPISKEIDAMTHKIDELEAELKELENNKGN